MTTGQRIARNLFTNGTGETATRVQLRDEHRSIGWRSRNEVAERIDEALATEWPEGREVTFSVRIHPNGDREIVGFTGALSGRLGWLLDEGAGLIEGDAPGYYLAKATSYGDHLRVTALAFETTEQRAERLAREESP